MQERIIPLSLYKDRGLTSLMLLGKFIQEESERQIEKWGIQKRTAFEWITYITEEVGELAKAVSEYEYRAGNIEDVVKEGIQSTTLILKLLESMYAGSNEHGLKPLDNQGEKPNE